MRLPKMLAALTGAMLLTGCSGLVSLNGFIEEKDAKTVPGLVGVWADPDGEDTLFVTESGSAYSIAYVDKSKKVMKFEARLMTVGEASILDLVSKDDAPFHIVAHTPVRVWVQGDTLRFAFLDSDWMIKRATEQLPLQAVDDRTVITAPGPAVRSFLEKHGGSDTAFKETATMTRLR
jgi:hypothetical protein